MTHYDTEKKEYIGEVKHPTIDLAAERAEDERLKAAFKPRYSRRNCRQCGKLLRPYRWRHLPNNIREGREWGDYGDNQFCGLRCGYRYGCDAAGAITGRV